MQVCLFSYGQTGAGKTHTMQGTRSPAGAGIIPRSVRKASLPQLKPSCLPGFKRQQLDVNLRIY